MRPFVVEHLGDALHHHRVAREDRRFDVGGVGLPQRCLLRRDVEQRRRIAVFPGGDELVHFRFEVRV